MGGWFRRNAWVAPYVLLGPGLLWLAVFYVYPAVQMFMASFWSGTVEQGYVFGLENWTNYSRAVSQFGPFYVRSIAYAFAATLLTFLVAYPLAYTIAFRGGRQKNLLLFLVVAPFFTSFLLRTIAWKIILSDSGPLLGPLKGIGLASEEFRLLSTPVAVISGITYNFLPFMTLPLYASLDRIDPRLIEAAADLYARPFTGFRKVTFPLSMPGVVGGTLLTFIPAAGDYINAQLLGSPKDKMIGNVIESQFIRIRDYPVAASMSFVLLVTILVLVTVYIRRAGTEELL